MCTQVAVLYAAFDAKLKILPELRVLSLLLLIREDRNQARTAYDSRWIASVIGWHFVDL